MNIALTVALLVLVPTSDAQTSPQKQASGTKLPSTNATPEKKFPFNVVTVQQEPQTTMYRVEGLSADNWRFLLSCHSVPPPGLKGREGMIRWLDKYGSLEKFQKVVPEDVGFASLTSDHSTITLYAYDGPFDLVSRCIVLNRIPYGENVFPITVDSSDLQQFKDGIGYRIESETQDESMTLLCAAGGPPGVCASVQPKSYRATRNGSLVRLYDSDLNRIGDYVIFSERKK